MGQLHVCIEYLLRAAFIGIVPLLHENLSERSTIGLSLVNEGE